ncbi:MAG: GNAT family N-acetyltransferase [Polyangiaceae bacterium]
MPSIEGKEGALPEVEILTHADISQNVALSHAVGWQDTSSDWEVIYDSALVLGIRERARLVAQGILGSFGGVGTLAKLVTAPERQHAGLGRRVLDALLVNAERQGLSTLGLVATPLGRHLFEAQGFVVEGEIVVLMGTPHVPLGHGHASPIEILDEALALDRQLLACDRSKMLRCRESRALATAGVTGHGGKLSGYAMATELGSHALVGPVIAEDEEGARNLFVGLCRELGDAVRIDVPSDHQSFRQWLRSIGLREQGTRVEMRRGSVPLPYRARQRYALATQAWG